MLAAVFFFALARFRRSAVGPIYLFALVTDACLLFGPLPLLVFAHPRIGERVGTRIAFVFGQRAKHDA